MARFAVSRSTATRDLRALLKECAATPWTWEDEFKAAGISDPREQCGLMCALVADEDEGLGGDGAQVTAEAEALLAQLDQTNARLLTSLRASLGGDLAGRDSGRGGT